MRIPQRLLARVIAACLLLQPAASRAASVGAERYRPPFPLMGLTAMTGDRWLIFSADGRVQIRQGTDAWSTAFQLPVTRIIDVRATADGFIAAGTLAPGQSAVVQLDLDGTERDRWLLPASPSSLLADGFGIAATMRDAWTPLLPHGKLGASVPFDLPRSGALALVSRRSATEISVACWLPDLTLEHKRQGECANGVTPRWKVEGDFSGAIVCGEWLVVSERQQPWRLTAYNLPTGKSGWRKSSPSPPSLACVGTGALLVGDRRISLVKPPARSAMWRSPDQPAAVTDLAVSEHAFAYRLDNSSEVFIETLPGTPR